MFYEVKKEELLRLYYKDSNCSITQGDCLEVMAKMVEKGLKFDAIITDPPYGTTACKWDSIIPFDKLWNCLNRLSKENAPIVLFGSQPFTTELIHSNIKNFKYCWVWNKRKGGSPLLSKIQPLRITEDVSVFCNGKVTYYPIMEKRDKPVSRGKNKGNISETTNNAFIEDRVYTEKYPKNILDFSNADQTNRLHPTQKPLDLMEYLIKTYTNEGDTILDFTCGSGTTLVASKKLNRRCYGIELEEKYCEISKNRLIELDT